MSQPGKIHTQENVILADLTVTNVLILKTAMFVMNRPSCTTINSAPSHVLRLIILLESIKLEPVINVYLTVKFVLMLPLVKYVSITGGYLGMLNHAQNNVEPHNTLMYTLNNARNVIKHVKSVKDPRTHNVLHAQKVMNSVVYQKLLV